MSVGSGDKGPEMLGFLLGEYHEISSYDRIQIDLWTYGL